MSTCVYCRKDFSLGSYSRFFCCEGRDCGCGGGTISDAYCSASCVEDHEAGVPPPHSDIDSPPAQPLAADTSPPSRTSSAASENDAAYLLELLSTAIREWGISAKYYSGFDPFDLLSARDLAVTIQRVVIEDFLSQRIEVSGVEGHASANEVPSTQKPTLNRAGIYAEMEPRSNPQGDAESVISAAGINPGLTSSLTREQALQLLDRYAAANIDRWCTGELKPQVDAAAEACLEAFGIGTAKARSLDAPESLVGRESRNTCGKIAQKPVGTAGERSPDWIRAKSLDAPTNPPRSYESQASTVFDAHGTAQHVAPASPSIQSGCGSGVSEGLNIGSEPSVPNAPNADEFANLTAKIRGGMKQLADEAEALVLEPMSEPTIRAAVYGCTDAKCVCGRCGPIKIALTDQFVRVLR